MDFEMPAHLILWLLEGLGKGDPFACMVVATVVVGFICVVIAAAVDMWAERKKSPR
jgi:hypothetical protein